MTSKSKERGMNDQEMIAMLVERFVFAHDRRTKNRQYYVDRKTHIASPFHPTEKSSLYHQTVTMARHTINPETHKPFELPTQQNIFGAMSQLVTIAKNRPIDLAKRSRLLGDDLWVDLGRDDGKALLITPAGLSVREPDEAIAWMRDDETGCMNEPVANASIETGFDTFAGMLGQDRDTVAQLIAVGVHRIIHPNGPGSQQPLVLIEGPSGAGKSMASLMYQDLVDPKQARFENTAGVINPEALRMNAAASSVLVLGNANRVPQEIWDLLCTIATGGIDSARKHYNQEEVVRWFMDAQVVMTGISVGRIPEDVITRLVHIELSPRARGDTEQIVWKRWDAHIDEMRTGLWLLCSRVMRMERDGSIPVDHLEGRLRDFEITLRAVDMVLGTHGETAWLSSQEGEQRLQQSDNPVFMAIVDRWDDIAGQWLTAAELYKRLKSAFAKIDSGTYGTNRYTPKSHLSLAKQLDHLLPILDAHGISMERRQDSHRKVGEWRFQETKGFALPDNPLAQEPNNGPFAGMGV